MPDTSVVMVTMHENPDYLFEAVKAVKAGAAGYVLKDVSGERLLGAVRRTLGGESPLDQELAMRLLVRLARESSYIESENGDGRTPGRDGQASSEAVTNQGQIQSLTPREVEVLRLLSQGQTNPQISKYLHFSVSTVKAHVRSILAKLGVSVRTQAAVRAIEFGLNTPGTD